LSSKPGLGLAIGTPTLVLDLDGTLVDTAGDLVATLNLILQGEGLRPLAFEDARGLVGNGAKAMLEAGFIASGAHLAPERLDVLFDAFISYYTEHIADRSAPFPGALAALDRFATEGWRLAICTNKLEGLARHLLGRLGIVDRFALVAGQDTFGVRKPDPRHLTETIAGAGGDPQFAVMVGDADFDIVVARAAAVPVIGVSFGYSPVPIADLLPDRVIDHFDELFEAAAALIRR
jgi:phosphoglycolate phosphatase